MSIENLLHEPTFDTRKRPSLASKNHLLARFQYLLEFKIPIYTSIRSLCSNSIFDFIFDDNKYCKYSDITPLLTALQSLATSYTKIEDGREQHLNSIVLDYLQEIKRLSNTNTDLTLRIIKLERSIAYKQASACIMYFIFIAILLLVII